VGWLQWQERSGSDDEPVKGPNMLRFLQLTMAGVLCALAAFAAGITEALPASVEIVLVACLALCFGGLLASTTASAENDQTTH
jgi:hypothetical protein